MILVQICTRRPEYKFHLQQFTKLHPGRSPATPGGWAWSDWGRDPAKCIRHIWSIETPINGVSVYSLGVVRRQAVQRHRVHVQSSGHRHPAVSAVGAQGEYVLLRPHPARSHVASKWFTTVFPTSERYTERTSRLLLLNQCKKQNYTKKRGCLFLSNINTYPII